MKYPKITPQTELSKAPIEYKQAELAERQAIKDFAFKIAVGAIGLLAFFGLLLTMELTR